MQRLILAANTPLPDVEAAIARFIEILEEKTGETAEYEVLFGRADYPPRVYHKQIVLMLGYDSFKVNADSINPKSVGIILGNAMTLGCIKGDNVVKFDFKPKPDGSGFYLKQKEQRDLVNEIRKGYFDSESTGVTTQVLDLIPNTLVPNVLSGVKETTTFAAQFASLNYSVRNELDRDRIRRAVFKWVVTKESIEVLEEKLCAIVGKNTKAIQNLVDTFDPENEKHKFTATNMRSALTSCFNYAKQGKANIPFEKIADNNHVSPYDLRYTTFLFKKDPLLIEDMNSTEVHYNNNKFRANGSPDNESKIDDQKQEDVDEE